MHFIPINSGQPYTVLYRNSSERERAGGNRLNSIFKENMLICRVNLYLPVVLTHSLTGQTVRSLNPGRWCDFPHPFVTDLGPTQISVTGVPGLFLRVKVPGVWHQPLAFCALNDMFQGDSYVFRWDFCVATNEVKLSLCTA